MSSSTSLHVPGPADESSGRLVAGLAANLPPPPGIPQQVAYTRVSFGGGHASPTLWDWLLSVMKGGSGG